MRVPALAVAGGGDGEGAVGVGGGDGPQGAVADVPPVGQAQAAVVPPGEDPVAGPGVAADPAGGLVAERHGGTDHLSGGDAVGVGALVERGHGGVVRGDEQGGLAGVGVGLPRRVRGVEDRLGGAVGDPPVGGVLVEDGGVAGAQASGGVGFPAVGEPPQRVQLGGSAGLGEEPERAAGPDRGQLVVVPDEQQLRPGGLGVGAEPVQVEGGRQGRLVDDDELAGLEPVAGLLAVQDGDRGA